MVGRYIPTMVGSRVYPAYIPPYVHHLGYTRAIHHPYTPPRVYPAIHHLMYTLRYGKGGMLGVIYPGMVGREACCAECYSLFGREGGMLRRVLFPLWENGSSVAQRVIPSLGEWEQ